MQTALSVGNWLADNREIIFRAIEFAGLVVGIVALVIATVELRHVRKLLGRTEQIAVSSQKLAGETAQIANSMSTQFVGEFPFNLNTITELLERAKAHVQVMVDIAAYGHYSNPEAFLEYFQQLERLARDEDIQLRMIVYDEKLNEEGRADQFGGEAEFAAICADRKFEQYFAKHKGSIPDSYAKFIEFLKIREDQRKQMLHNDGAKIQESTERFRFFLWLVDDVEAVFAFQVCGEHFREICFRTKDGNLIHTFSDIFRQAWNQQKAPAAAAPEQHGALKQTA